MIGWFMIKDEWRAGLRNRLNVDRGHRDGGELHLRRRRVGQRTEVSVSGVLWDIRMGAG